MNKLEDANNNIKDLISLIVFREKMYNSGYCPYSEQETKEKCKVEDNYCKKCEDCYYETMKNELIEKYLIK